MKTLCFVCCLSLCLTTAAQQKDAPPPRKQFAWVAPQGEEIKSVIDAFAGTWKTEEAFEPNAGMKDRMLGSGTMVVHPGPGGNSVVFDYTSSSAMGPYSSVRTIYWDRSRRIYRAFYCDSLQPTGCGESGTGSWQGNALVFDATTHDASGPFLTREKFAVTANAEFTFSLDTISAGKAKRSLTITAKKQ